MSGLGEEANPPIGLTRSRDPAGTLLQGGSSEFHGWKESAGPFPRFQTSDGLVLSEVLDHLAHRAAERTDGSIDYQHAAMRLTGDVDAADFNARLVVLDPHSGSFQPLYPDVSMDDDRRKRASRCIESVFSIDVAERLVGQALREASADRSSARALGGALVERFWTDRLYGAGRQRRDPTEAECEQWVPCALAALEEFQASLRQAKDAGFAKGFFLAHPLKIELSGEDADAKHGVSHGDANGTLFSRFRDWLSGLGRR